MVNGCINADGLERCLLPRSHNVPADTTLSQMIECREALRKQERWLERSTRCDTEGEIFGHGCHG